MVFAWVVEHELEYALVVPARRNWLCLVVDFGRPLSTTLVLWPPFQPWPSLVWLDDMVCFLPLIGTNAIETLGSS